MKCKCGRPLVKSPLNPKVRICDGCINQKANCTCAPLPKLDLMEALKQSLRRSDASS